MHWIEMSRTVGEYRCRSEPAREQALKAWPRWEQTGAINGRRSAAHADHSGQPKYEV